MKIDNRRKFRNLLINPSYQLRYVLLIVATGAILSLMNTGVFYTFARENYEILVDLSPMTDDARNLLYSELKRIAILMTLSSFVFTLALAFLALYFTHRSAGPLYQFKRVFDEIASGKKESRLKLRPNDDFQDVAESFNRMMDNVEKHR